MPIDLWNNVYKFPQRHNAKHVILYRLHDIIETPPRPTKNETDCINVDCPNVFSSTMAYFRCS